MRDNLPNKPPPSQPDATASSLSAIARMRAFLKVLMPKLGFMLFACAVVWVVGTTIFSPDTTTGPVYLALIYSNLLIATGLILFLGRRFLLLFLERRRGMIGTRLHVRLMGIFGLLAVVPAILVAVSAYLLLNQGIEAWFSSRVTSALDGSLEVAQAYFKEHGNRLRVEAETLAADPSLRSSGFLLDSDIITAVLLEEKDRRTLSEISLYAQDGELIAHAGDVLPTALSLDMTALLNDPSPRSTVFARHEDGRIVAAAPMNNGNFIVLTRWVNPAVLAHMDETQKAYKEYYKLRSERGTFRLIFLLTLALLTTVSLVWAIWAGLRLAGQIVKPVTALVHATNTVSTGRLDVRVEPLDDDELGILTQAFNRMIRQMKENRSLLERKNHELDDRRRTMEAVLTGVTAGVMSIDADGKVRLANKTARDSLSARSGMRLETFCPELSAKFEPFVESGREVFQEQIRVQLEDEARTLLVRMVPQRTGGGKVQSVVVTFDDITALLSAQNLAAWSDVARRIAHEIKNPLTPIQLSAERLKRKFSPKLSKMVEDEADIALFGSLTDTIVRQVEDMRQLVNEFSDFARMPAPTFEDENLATIIDELLTLERTARPHIRFTTELYEDTIPFCCDRSHISRLLTNLVENAVNAIEEKEKSKTSEPSEKNDKDEVKIVVNMPQDDILNLSVSDTGHGLPKDMDADKLFDPYVTTRKKGTGLGLSIVRRVVDEHGGQIRLLRRAEQDGGGTQVEIAFNVAQRGKEAAFASPKSEQLAEQSAKKPAVKSAGRLAA